MEQVVSRVVENALFIPQERAVLINSLARATIMRKMGQSCKHILVVASTWG